MYSRIYPLKSNTLLKGYSSGHPVEIKNGIINTSQSPIMEIHNGNKKSYLIFQFDAVKILDLIDNFNYQSKIKIFDSGTLSLPTLSNEEFDVFWFYGDWNEGNGSNFNLPNIKSMPSNWLKRNINQYWSNEFTTNLLNRYFTLNKPTQDIIFDIKNILDDLKSNNSETLINIGIKLTESVTPRASIIFNTAIIGEEIDQILIQGVNILKNPIAVNSTNTEDLIQDIYNQLISYPTGYNLEINLLNLSELFFTPQGDVDNSLFNNDSVEISINNFLGLSSYTSNPFTGGINGWKLSQEEKVKYVHSQNTRTIFVPFIELVTEDIYLNYPRKFYPNSIQKFQIKIDPTLNPNLITVELRNSSNLLQSTGTVNHLGKGLYETNINVGDKIGYLVWKFSGSELSRQLINIMSGSDFLYSPETPLKFFATSDKLEYNIGDKMKIYVVWINDNYSYLSSENFEVRVKQSNGFEMVPWQKVNVDGTNMWVTIDLSYFFPDIWYYIDVRYISDSTLNYNESYKFKVRGNNDLDKLDKNHSSPHNERDYYIRGINHTRKNE